MERGIMLIEKFVLKVINNERKVLTNMKSLIALQNKLCQCSKNQIVAVNFLIYLFI